MNVSILLTSHVQWDLCTSSEDENNASSGRDCKSFRGTATIGNISPDERYQGFVRAVLV